GPGRSWISPAGTRPGSGWARPTASTRASCCASARTRCARRPALCSATATARPCSASTAAARAWCRWRPACRVVAGSRSSTDSPKAPGWWYIPTANWTTGTACGRASDRRMPDAVVGHRSGSAVEDHVRDDPRGNRHHQEIPGVAAAPVVATRRVPQAVAAVVMDDVGRGVAAMAVVAAAGPGRRATVGAGMVDHHRARDMDHADVAAIVPTVVAAIVAAIVAAMVRATVVAAAPILAGMAAVMATVLVVARLGRRREGEAQ